ncbi:MAG: AAA family ATPase [Mycobacteriales bacterium]|nr:AAA family ATPase [Mycobacteriales bacterium]
MTQSSSTAVVTVAVVDRTGALLGPVRLVADGLDPAPHVLDVDKPAEFSPADLGADVLVVGSKELTGAGLKRIQSWHEVHPHASVIAQLGDGAPTAAVLRAHGVTAWFRGDASAARLQPLLSQALDELVEAVDDSAAVPFEELVEAVPREAMLLTVASATGGCGKTFLATNTAAHLASAGRRVLLVDFDLQFGEVAAALQIRHGYSVYDGLYDASGRALPEEALAEHFDELVFHSPLGFDVLAAPRDPALADYITADDAARVLDTTIEMYDVVIVDTPPSLNDVVLTALDRSALIAVVTILDVPSLRNLTSFLEIMSELEVDEDRLRLVLNKVEDDIGINVGQAQDAFGGRFVAEVPASKAASRSINTGTVVLRSEPRTPLARAMVRTIEALLPDTVLPRGVDAAAHADDSSGKTSRFSRNRKNTGGTA